jgi:hypothetical protein
MKAAVVALQALRIESQNNIQSGDEDDRMARGPRLAGLAAVNCIRRIACRID